MPMFKAVAQDKFVGPNGFGCTRESSIHIAEAKDLSEFLLLVRARFPGCLVGSVYFMEPPGLGQPRHHYKLGPCVFAGFEQEPTNEQPNP